VRSIPEFKHGVDWDRLLREHPALYDLEGRPELCTFLCCRWMVDELRIRFGDELRIRQLSDAEIQALANIAPAANKNWLIEVSVITDPAAAEDFAWNNPNECWLVGPEDAKKGLHKKFALKQAQYKRVLEAYEALHPQKKG
jgi:hypothetical protein